MNYRNYAFLFIIFLCFVGLCIFSLKEEDTFVLDDNIIVKDYYEIDPTMVYGGGVNEENIKDINNIEAVEGVLVGGASLNSERIKKLYELTK